MRRASGRLPKVEGSWLEGKSDDGDVAATARKELGTRFSISSALRILVSVVVIVVIRSVAPWETIQNRPNDIGARLLQQPDRALDRGSLSLANPDDEANRIEVPRQEQSVAYSIYWRGINDYAVVIAQ